MLKVYSTNVELRRSKPSREGGLGSPNRKGFSRNTRREVHWLYSKGTALTIADELQDRELQTTKRLLRLLSCILRLAPNFGFIEDVHFDVVWVTCVRDLSLRWFRNARIPVGSSCPPEEEPTM